MPARKQVAPDRTAEGKYLYEQTLVPTDEIGARMGLSRSAFYLRVKQWGWQRRRYSSGLVEEALVVPVSVAAPAVEAREAGAEERPPLAEKVTRDSRAALYARVYRAAAAQIDTVERVQKTLQPTHPAPSERTARILAALNKTLLEIAALTKPDQGAPPDEADDDSVPRDIDECRRELARRIRGFVDARRNRAAGLCGEPGDSLG
jgi:hypothetical protein